jgi:hypothetical protein
VERSEGIAMTIRTFEAGDEAAQVRIYNEAAAERPKFKPATLDEIRRRLSAADFDPRTRYFAIEDGQAVGYAGFHANGRVSYPWCAKGYERWAEPLFEQVLEAMRAQKMGKAWAAYRADWTGEIDFLRAHGFEQVREMVNFVLDLVDMPTPSAQRASTISPISPSDIPRLISLGKETLRTSSVAELEQHWLHNMYYSPQSLFALRNRADQSIEGVAIIIVNPAYAGPKQVDSAMPCFRLGAFGAEGMQSKRINGLFSFLANPADAGRLGLDLLGHAGHRLIQSNVEAFAAQVPSDSPHLLRFYQHHFRKQGAFPVLERLL